MKHGPYEPDGPLAERPAGAFTGARSWQTLACIQGRHEECHDLRRCDCRCHAFTTGALRLHQEPS